MQDSGAANPAPTDGKLSRESLARAALQIDGMHCAGCAARVERALAATSGVSSARVNLLTHEAVVDYDARCTDEAALVRTVEQAGYRASLRVAEEAAALEAGDDFFRLEQREAARWRRRFLVGLAATIALLGLMHGLEDAPAMSLGLQAAGMTFVQGFVGGPFLAGAVRGLLRGAATMDALVAVGTGAAYLAGMGQWIGRLLHPDHPSEMSGMYFFDAAMILTFIALGKHLESRAKGRASAALRKLLDLTPREAVVLRGQVAERLPVGRVDAGETILIRPGERVPLDARIVRGSSAVDASWLTGESLPADKTPGDEVFAGTVNLQNALTAVVLRPIGKTALAQTIELVRRAQASKPKIGRPADRVTAWFVPGVLLVAACTAIVWGPIAGEWETALRCTVAVLVVACPCALGLATPAAILVGTGRGAECGILIRDAAALESAGRITAIVLDKTGTVTLGKPAVTAIVPVAGVSEDELLTVAAAVERLSGHPLGEAVVREAERRGLTLPMATELRPAAGQGVRSRCRDLDAAIGNDRLMAAEGVDVAPLTEVVEAARRRGETPLWTALGHRLLGAIVVADPVAPHAREAIAELQSLGFEMHLVSGDHAAAVHAVANEVGIDRVAAEALPADKGDLVRRLQAQGHVTAVVGDGINDAPALAAADVGIAVSSGADAAMEAADMVLVQRDLRSVATVVALSRAVVRTIRVNLAWAFGYNLVLLPAAAGVLMPWLGLHIPPAAAAAAMAASSVSVVANSLLLRTRPLRRPTSRLAPPPPR